MLKFDNQQSVILVIFKVKKRRKDDSCTLVFKATIVFSD